MGKTPPCRKRESEEYDKEQRCATNRKRKSSKKTQEKVKMKRYASSSNDDPVASCASLGDDEIEKTENSLKKEMTETRPDGTQISTKITSKRTYYSRRPKSDLKKSHKKELPEKKFRSKNSSNVAAAGSSDDEMDLLYYDRSPKVLLIVNYNYQKRTLNCYLKDKDDLIKLWENLGAVVEVKENRNRRAIMEDLSKFVDDTLSGDEPYFAVFILAHGGFSKWPYGEYILGTGEESQNNCILTDTILQKFDGISTPKIFVFQCCRGKNVRIEPTDAISAGESNNERRRMPKSASESVIVHATQCDYVSIVDNKGSWLIQAIVKVFTKYVRGREHVLDLLTRVNEEVSKQEVGEFVEQHYLRGAKCESEFKSTLRQPLFL